MKITIKAAETARLATLALIGAVALVGCGGGDSPADGGTGADASNDGDASGDGPVLFALSVGDSCFDILSVVGTPNDGCNFGVGDTVAMQGLIGAALPFRYDMTAVTISVGTDGILGGGPIANNMATLVHDADATDATMTTCMWHENVTSMVTVTAQNAFTISVVRTQSMFTAAPACTAASIPTGGTCTSTWTWTMAKSTTKTPATMCR